MKKRIILGCISSILSLVIVFCSFGTRVSDVNAATKITEEQLFLMLPGYLNCQVLDEYYKNCYGYCADALDTVSGTDEAVSSFLYGLKSGAKFLVREGASVLGVADSNFDSNNKKVAGELLKTYFSIEDNCMDDAKEIYEDYKYITKTYDCFSTSIIEDFKAANKKRKYIVYTDEYIDEIFADTKLTGKIIDKFGSAQEGLEVFMGIMETNQLEIETIDKLIASSRDVDSALTQGLIEIRDDITSDLPTYLLKNYFTDKALDKIAKYFQKATAGHISGGASILVGVLADVGYSIYSNYKPSVSDIMAANLLRSYTDSAGSMVDRMTLRFAKGEATSEDIETYRIVYNFYVTSLKLWMQKCKVLLKKSHARLKSKLTVYGDALGDEVNYDLFINACITKATKDLDDGIIKIEEDKVTHYTNDGKVIDSSYDSTESIKAKLAEIQKVYKPNVGQVWLSMYKGSTECNGFARMVFNKLFGYDITGYVGGDRSVLQNENNVIKVGQLKGTNVTKDKLKAIFENAKIGDFLQVCGGTYGQHSSIITSVDDGGVNVYDCNWSSTEYCVIKTHKFTWDNLISLYSTPYTTKEGKVIPNGVSIYRANNYSSIYGNGDDLFYDDSVNFVIENGVLIKYNGCQPYVIIPDEVTEIGNDAFRNNTTMIGVEIPESVTKIGSYAFAGCSQLLNVYIPDSVEEIGSYAFSQCIRLASIHLPDNEKYTEISSCLMLKDGKLQSIELPDNITKIGSSAFNLCESLKDLYIPNNVTYIDTRAFYKCTSLTYVELSTCLDTLGGEAFGECIDLNNVKIPKTLKNVWGDSSSSWKGPFYKCESLSDVEFDEGITTLPSSLFEYCNGLTSVTIPDTVTKIDRHVFEKCDNLETVIIPDSVTVIDVRAFNGCSKLKDIILPNNLVELGAEAFGKCISLKRICIPKSIKTVLGSANSSWYGPFADCEGLISVEFEEGTSVVKNCLFEKCTGIEEVSLPESIVKIEYSAFKNCENLTSIIMPNSLTEIDDSAFSYCTSLKEVLVPNSVKSIKRAAFSNCNELKKIIISDEITDLDESLFENCYMLSEIHLPKNLIKINTKAFYKCKSLNTIIIPDTVNYIGAYAFSNCESLSEIILPLDLETVGDYSFEYTPISGIIIPDSVTSIGKFAFQHCENLSDFSCGTGVKTISSYCFYEDYGIKNIVLPYSITRIDAYAFGNCTKLTDISLNRNISYIEISAFSYPDKLTIHGIPGTYAQSFASDNDINFVALENGAESIKLSKSELKLGVGEKTKLTASITPVDAVDELTWSSSDDDIVKVDSDGNVTAVTPGEAQILAMAGSVIETCDVSVYKAVTSVSLNKTSYEGTIGDEFTLVATVYPTDATYKTVTWSSSDDSIAEVDNAGNVTLKAYGTATITVKTDDKEKTKTCTITVKQISVTGVALNEKKVEVEPGKTVQLTAIITPENATDKSVTWSSSKPAIATVEDGLVTGLSEGSSVIIVKTVDGSKTATCTVTVKPDAHVHEWNDGVVTKEPTCTEQGEKTFTCKTCNETKVEPVDMIPHKLTEHKAVAVKCEEAGNELYYQCSICKKYFADSEATSEIEENSWIIDATGHDWGDWTVTKEPTDTEKGEYTRICNNDPTHIETKDIPEKNHVHNMKYVEAVEAHCNKPGNKAYYKCTDCGNCYEDEKGVIQILDENDLIITVSHSGGTATCKSGAICDVCGEEYGELNPNNHVGDTEIKGAKEATCKEEGYTGDIYCKGCGKKISSGESISKIDHKIVVDNAVKPTCTEKGLTEGKHCSVCGEIIEKQTEISATGHKWDDGKVTKEPTETDKGVKTYTCSVCHKTKTEDITAKGKKEESTTKPTVEPSPTSSPAVAKDNKTTFNIKNKATVKKSKKIKVKDKDKIKKITLNGKKVKIKKNKTSVSFKLKSYKKALKKNGKWNKLVVIDKKGNKKTIKLKTK